MHVRGGLGTFMRTPSGEARHILMISGMMIKKRSEFDLGSAFFGISEVDFLPMGTE